MPERGWPEARQCPPQIGPIGNPPGLRHEFLPGSRGEPRLELALSLGRDERLHGGASVGRDELHKALTVRRHEGIEVDELGDALGYPIGDASVHHAAGAVSDKDHATQVFILENVGSPRGGRGGHARRVRSAWGEYVVSARAEQRQHPLPAPAAEPSGMLEDELGHLGSLLHAAGADRAPRRPAASRARPTSEPISCRSSTVRGNVLGTIEF